jgi:hypothetical protein
MRGAARSAALAAAVLLAGLLAGGCGEPPPPTAPPLPPENRILLKCQEMKQRGQAKDLAGIQRLLDECLALDASLAGDAYLAAGAAVGEYIYAASPTGAERTALFQKKIDYFQKARAAFQAPGARTSASEELPKRIERCAMAIQLAQQELSGG